MKINYLLPFLVLFAASLLAAPTSLEDAVRSSGVKGGLVVQLGAADPTKSGSISKAFEMIIHQQCYESILDAGYDDGRIAEYEAAIRAHLLERMPKWMVPDDYVFIDEIPRTSTGKFSKLALREQLQE